MVAPLPRTDASTRQLQEIIADPVKFTKAILGYDTWDVPNRILRALSKPNARVAVKSCHASGKTFTGGNAVPWFMTRYPDAIVPTTAPTWIQVRDLLWKEIHTSILKSKIDFPPANNTDWRWSEDHYAIGISTTEADRFQGFHAPHVLIIIDEASGVRQPIFDAIEGIRAGGDVRVLMLGNPTISSGAFFNAFGRNAAGWQTFTIDAFDTPNFMDVPGKMWKEKLDYLLEREREGEGSPGWDYLNDNPWPFLITRRWVVERFHEWGTASPLWQARVRGQFPSKSEFSLIALEWAEWMRYNEQKKRGKRVLGVDVARYGVNNTVYTHMTGNVIDDIKVVQGRDTQDTFQRIREAVLADNELIVVIDDSGVGGGVVDACRAANVPVIPFNAAESVRMNVDCINRGSEAYWDLSLALRDRELSVAESVPAEIVDRLIQQLVQIEYKFSGKNQIQVMKAGLDGKKSSPDLADSLNMANTARKVATADPASTSGSIEPDLAGSRMGSSRMDDFFRSSSGRIGLTPNRSSIPQAAVYDPEEILTSLACPRCGQIGALRELGRVVNVRNYQFRCRGCGLEKPFQQTIGGRGGHS